MARVLVLTADLLFGSRLQGDLGAAGHQVELIGDETRLRARLAPRSGLEGRGPEGGSEEDSDLAAGVKPHTRRLRPEAERSGR